MAWAWKLLKKHVMNGNGHLTVSPSAISNTYSGQITNQVTGLTNGETVLVERFLDANTNGLVDAGELLVQGEPVTTRLLASRFVPADRRVAGALGLGRRARVLELERLRLVDGHPMSLQRSFVTAAVGEEILRADLATTPLRQALEFKLGITIERARETVSAVRLGRREARDLGCGAGVPAFASERISFDTEGRPAVFDRVFIPGDRFRITRELHYDASTSTTGAPE